MRGVANGQQWKQRKRAGLPMMSWRMLVVLQRLRAAADEGFPFIELPGVHTKTLKVMIHNDWIVRSDGLDGVRYKATGRGLKALEVYESPAHRFDSICPDCGVNPRAVNENGYQYGYCTDCNRRHGRRQYRLRGNQLNPEGLCAVPGCEAKRHVYPSGYTIPYCKPHREAMRKEERQRKRERLLRRVQAGELIPCLKCDQPRYVAGETVTDYCYEHYRAYQNAYLRRRKRQHFEQALSSAERCDPAA